ncbi:hypothetical protein U9M48_000264 [Paspalum notatum var. saurae]|uniref:Uncharacterized protein n=1 Tax=Paspalum notatum var. saurae TaxID=547442 RepID=A0AAQ3PK07_PASNO
MAAILDAFAPHVKKLIADMAQEEVSMLLGVSGEITKLGNNMENLRAFLTDAERRRVTEERVQIWVRKLKGAMYDATDIMDLCQLKAERRRESGGDGNVPPGCLQPLLFCLRNPVFAHKIGSRIKELNQRLEGIHKAARDFCFNINLPSYPEQQRALTATSYQARSQIDESAIVGEQIERDTKELVQVLTTTIPDDDDNNTHHQIKVVSIVGTGGMGKTTLAQKIFNEATIKEHFKTKMWLSITKHFDDADLLRTAINHAEGDQHGHGHGEHQDGTSLTDTLTRTLASAGRFLLVMDDVWSERAWDNVLGVPVRNASRSQPGSWVLVTTRSAHLPQRMRAPLHEHHVRPLHQDDAWSLLKKQLQPAQIARADHLKDVGMEIVRRCGGFPLAVKVMGGLLSTKSQTKHEWAAVLNHRAWSVVGLPKELDNRIYMSYEDLSPQLKQCFLYCSLIPKGTPIFEGRITSMWISEGFVQPQGGSNSHDDRLEEIATDYYHELITRNLIESTSIDRYECTMHDVVRSFAEFMAKEDSIVVYDNWQIAGGSNHNETHVRRLSLVQNNLLAEEWTVLQRQDQLLRTLIINCKINFELNESLISFSRLRVLYIVGGDCDKLVGSLSHLRHLRYLRLQRTNISRLPENIHTLKFLQHIVLRDDKNLENLPVAITKLANLRTLSLSDSNTNVVMIPKGFGRLTNLRSLYGFPVHMATDKDGGWCTLEEIGPLSQLRNLTLYGLENVVASSLAEMEMISTKKHLGCLELHWSNSRWMTLRDEIRKQEQQQEVEEVIEKLHAPSRIQSLFIVGYFGHRLPSWMMVHATGAFESLRYLNLRDLPCCTQLPDGLCLLPCLEALSIQGAPAIEKIGPEFQSPSSLSVASSFPCLTTLYLQGLCQWKEWEWEEQGEDETAAQVMMAMSMLKILVVNNCKLCCLPPGLASSKRHALRELYLYDLTNLASVENFPSVVKLDVFYCPKLKRISGLSRLQSIRIFRCRNVEVLEGVASLDSMEMEDAAMETLPEYLTTVNLRYLKLTCSKKLRESLLTASSTTTSSPTTPTATSGTTSHDEPWRRKLRPVVPAEGVVVK